ncbi:unnamed protein product [Miscanthus lutarioriparius]|uniref:Uncharacterized protein n=1 Tax=Miscanthus lutarioriparius TaxID=422564 RepID=A0A811RC04_9POAL|nr:unnamed protein product [Miscanthus lutarioriparius]
MAASASKTRRAILVLFIWAVAMLFFMAALHPNVLTAADQVYCMCCADRRECEQDPTCCTDGCCRMRP